MLVLLLTLLACGDREPEPERPGFMPHCLSAESPLAHDVAAPSGVVPDTAAASLDGVLAAGEGVTAQLQVSPEGARWIDQSEAPIPPDAIVATIAIICTDSVALPGSLTLTGAGGAPVATLPVTVHIQPDEIRTLEASLTPEAVAPLWGDTDTAAYTDIGVSLSGTVSPEGAMTVQMGLEGTIVQGETVGRVLLRSLTLN